MKSVNNNGQVAPKSPTENPQTPDKILADLAELREEALDIHTGMIRLQNLVKVLHHSTASNYGEILVDDVACALEVVEEYAGRLVEKLDEFTGKLPD